MLIKMFFQAVDCMVDVLQGYIKVRDKANLYVAEWNGQNTLIFQFIDDRV